MVQIHFGAGRLGLGLLGPLANQSKFPFVILNREASDTFAREGDRISPSQKNALLLNASGSFSHYALQSMNMNETKRGISLVPFAGFQLYNDENVQELGQTYADDVAELPFVFITATLTNVEFYMSVFNFLIGLVDRLNSLRSTCRVYLMCCENDFNTDKVWDFFSSLISPAGRRRITPVRSVVDRICTSLTEEQGILCVLCEEFGRVTIEDRNLEKDFRDKLADNPLVRMTHHFEAERDLKIFVVNGSHLAIALQSYAKRPWQINEFISFSNENAEFAWGLIQEIRDGTIAVLQTNTKRYGDFATDPRRIEYVNTLALEFFERIRTTDDYATRILSRFRKPALHPAKIDNVQRFMNRFDSRVIEPMQGYAARYGKQPLNLTTAFVSMIKLISTGQFVDVDQDVSFT